MNDKEIIEFLLTRGIDSKKDLRIGLIGPLGIGKTELVKKLLFAISRDLGKSVHSPTFNICNIYSSNQLKVYHFDLYRIENEEQLFDIELWECMDNNKDLVIIEWVDMFSDIMENCDINISIQEDNEGVRLYSILETEIK